MGSPNPLPVCYAFLDFADGGAQRLTLGTCARLDRDRFRPHLLCVRGRGSLIVTARRQGLPVHLLGRLDRPFDLGAVGEIRRYLAAHSIEVVHVPLYSRASPYVRLAARRARTPLVVAHEYCRPAPPRLLRRLADRWLRPGTRFVAASERHREELVRQGVARSAIEVIYSGIELADFAPRDRRSARRALALPADRPIVLVLARLHPMKGHQDLLAALPRLRQEVPGVLVLCAGDGPLRHELPARAVELGVGSAVRFLGHRDDVPQLLAAADLVALPSRIEGVPAAMLEAFAAHRPVVATDVGGVGEVLRDGVEGRLVASGQPDHLAAALAELLSAGTRREEMAERAAHTARRFTATAAARQLEAAYDRWLAAPGR